MKKLIVIVVLLLLATGCAHVSTVSDLMDTAADNGCNLKSISSDNKRDKVRIDCK